MTPTSKKGITHIEDLSPDNFIGLLSNLRDYRVTEKVDGSQILFGLDDLGFYTSRESKGGERVYNSDDYTVSFHTTYRRAAHALLEQVLPQLRDGGLVVGDQIEAEVLYGGLPNVVPYSDSINYLVFLRTVTGDVDIGTVQKKLMGLTVQLCLPTPVTHDGRTATVENRTSQWRFSSVPEVSIDIPKIDIAVGKKLIAMQDYLDEKTRWGIDIRELVSMPLNRMPLWCPKESWANTKAELQVAREYGRNTLQEMKLGIKESLLISAVRSLGSKFNDSKDSWVEGIVLRHRETGEMVKVVDKEFFGIAREFAWQVRNGLAKKPSGIVGDISFMGQVSVGLASMLAHPHLGTTYAKTLVGKIDISTVVFPEKSSMLSFLESSHRDLVDRLDKYEYEEHLYSVVIGQNECSRTVSYKGSPIGIRTRETFAHLFERVDILKQQISKAETPEELIKAITGYC
jgi:hypothetical protein